MSETQLERSVLEAKDRDELFAIANALGATPGARAKKADLVSSILQATGVESESGGAEEKPRRTRARKATAVTHDPATTNGAEDAALPPPSDPGENEVVEVMAETAASNGEAAPAAEREQPTGRSGGRAVPEARQADTQPSPAAPADIPGRPSFNSGEPGNRRNRRRRGRDRFERAERELPGQMAETQYAGEPLPVTGYLDLRDEGYGFLRTSGFLAGPGDVYVSISQVRRFALRKGDYLEGAARPGGW